MTPDDPRHGTYAGALAHRRAETPICELCSLAQRRTMKVAKLRLDRGVRNRIALGDRAWATLRNLGCTRVSEATGMWRNNLYRIQRSGPETLVLRSTRDAILAAHGPTPVGIQRRIQALGALGHTAVEVAALAGVHHDPLNRIARRPTPPALVKQHLADGVCAAYDALQDVAPPASRVHTRRRSIAAARGWLPPAAWDDIDDPAEVYAADADEDEVDELVVEWILAGEYRLAANAAERTEVFRRWHEAGRPLNELERVTGWRAARYFKVREQVVA